MRLVTGSLFKFRNIEKKNYERGKREEKVKEIRRKQGTLLGLVTLIRRREEKKR